MLKRKRKLSAREFHLGYVEEYGEYTNKENYLRIFEDNGMYQLRGFVNAINIRDARPYLSEIRQLITNFNKVAGSIPAGRIKSF